MPIAIVIAIVMETSMIVRMLSLARHMTSSGPRSSSPFPLDGLPSSFSTPCTTSTYDYYNLYQWLEIVATLAVAVTLFSNESNTKPAVIIQSIATHSLNSDLVSLESLPVQAPLTTRANVFSSSLIHC